ncbi:TraB/GumN family protein [Pseudocnuella soli]|uniref:TraB/GumN family protein n=1 Tax=Pseudocnuella soli TaxID=2502779 RepID=UPI0010527354|nr:TraB/GumN family protein [Pseudocnuella soli]
MKKFCMGLLVMLGLTAGAQNSNTQTLLWRVSGNGLASPSYVFGTIHMICADDIQLSDSLVSAIGRSSQVYLELDMDNLFEMMGAMRKMKMRGDTTLADLLSEEDYASVKEFFKNNKSPIPFSMLETFKPMLAASTLMESALTCSNAIAMEQLVMKEAKKNRKDVKGLESMAYQLSIFDSIPYKLQAEQLAAYVKKNHTPVETQKEFAELAKAYRMQDLKKMEQLTVEEDMGMSHFTDLLLYNRNANWVAKMQGIMKSNAAVFAVGAGHLPGDKGVLSLLRKMGYKVEPVENKMDKKLTREM